MEKSGIVVGVCVSQRKTDPKKMRGKVSFKKVGLVGILMPELKKR
jgi:hypothetical protein